MKIYEFKPHPLAIWDYIKPLLFVWILPVVKRAAERAFSIDAPRGFFLEATTIVAIGIYGVLKFKNYRIAVDKEKIIFKSGNLLKKEKFIYREGIFAARAQKTVWNIIFGGLTLFLQLEGRNKEIKLRLSKSNTQDILKILFGE